MTGPVGWERISSPVTFSSLNQAAFPAVVAEGGMFRETAVGKKVAVFEAGSHTLPSPSFAPGI